MVISELTFSVFLAICIGIAIYMRQTQISSCDNIILLTVCDLSSIIIIITINMA